MSTTTFTEETTDTFRIALSDDGTRFVVERNGEALRDREGFVREFATRNSARKRIARERSGDLHA